MQLNAPRSAVIKELGMRRGRGWALMHRGVATTRELGGLLAETVAWDEATAAALSKFLGEDELRNYVLGLPGLEGAAAPGALEFRHEAVRHALRLRLSRLERVMADVERDGVGPMVELPAPHLGPVHGEASLVVVGPPDHRTDTVAAMVLQLAGRPPKVFTDATALDDPDHRVAAEAVAIVVLTPDQTRPLNRRRPAPAWTLVALGFLAGALGPDHVVVVADEEVDCPVVPRPVVVTPMDDTGRWRAELVRLLAPVLKQAS